MSEEVALTPEGQLRAMGLIGAHLKKRGAELEKPAGKGPNELMLLVLMAYGAMQTEKRTQAWFEAEMDRLLGLERVEGGGGR